MLLDATGAGEVGMGCDATRCSHLLHASATNAGARAGPKRVLRVDVSHRALHVAVRLERAPAVHVLTAVDVRALAALALARAVAVAHGERRSGRCDAPHAADARF